MSTIPGHYYHSTCHANKWRQSKAQHTAAVTVGQLRMSRCRKAPRIIVLYPASLFINVSPLVGVSLGSTASAAHSDSLESPCPASREKLYPWLLDSAPCCTSSHQNSLRTIANQPIDTPLRTSEKNPILPRLLQSTLIPILLLIGYSLSRSMWLNRIRLYNPGSVAGQESVTPI